MPTRVARRPYGSGVYRRHVRLAATADTVRADLEDDFHRFGVRLRHDGSRVLECRGEAERVPWNICPGATAPLERLAGTPLSRSLRATAGHHDARSHCTHLFDLASLAIAHAAAGRGERDYAIAIPDRVEGHSRPTLHRDGTLLLDWEIDGRSIVGPERFRDQPLWGGLFPAWAEQELDPDTAEAALLLHRACAISLGRAYDLDRTERATDFGDAVRNACFSFAPERIETARREVGTTLDFSDEPERLLSDL